MNQRTVYVTGEDDALIKLFEHRPWQLNKEITEQTGGPIHRVYLTNSGDLRIITQDNSQKNKLLRLNHIDNKPVRVSLPYVLTKKQGQGV